MGFIVGRVRVCGLRFRVWGLGLKVLASGFGAEEI